MAKEGLIFVLPSLVLALAFFALRLPLPACVFLVLTLLFLFFFRDPSRVPPPLNKGEILSPADGRVLEIVSTPEGQRMSIFLALYNVHLFLAPMEGNIKILKVVEGKFHPAYKVEASTENSRVKVEIDGNGKRVEMDVIAGVAARRIRPWKRQGESVVLGERMGIVMFGSRVDLFVPKNFRFSVKIGDRVKGALTVLGRFGEEE